MAYNYRLLPEAQIDIDKSLDWYHARGGHALKNRFFRAYLNARLKICQAPKQYPFAYKPYRKVQLRTFPFKIIYRLENEIIYIVAVAHNKRKPNFWKTRS